MKLLNKNDVTPICKQIASEYEGWKYVGECFKYPLLKHSILSIEPLWTMNLSAQPIVAVTNKKVNKLSKQALNERHSWFISTKKILAPDATLETQVYQKLVYTLDEAEEYIRDFFKRGLILIEEHYNYTDEVELLTHMPVDLDGSKGIAYCLSRVVIHDFDFAYKFVNDEIETVAPKHVWVEKLKPYIPIWENNYKETGSIFGKK